MCCVDAPGEQSGEGKGEDLCHPDIGMDAPRAETDIIVLDFRITRAEAALSRKVGRLITVPCSLPYSP